MRAALRSSIPLALCAGLSALPLLGGCGPSEVKWTEEVKLHDGKLIQVQRRIEFSDTGFWSKQRGDPKSYELCYAPLGIYWKSKPQYQPETFDIVNDKAYARVPLTGCSVCQQHGYPTANSLHFVWDGKDWSQIGHREFPPQIPFNLLDNAYYGEDKARDAKDLVTLADKEKRDVVLYYELRVYGSKAAGERVGRNNLCAECKLIPMNVADTAEIFVPSKRRKCE